MELMVSFLRPKCESSTPAIDSKGFIGVNEFSPLQCHILTYKRSKRIPWRGKERGGRCPPLQELIFI